MTHLAVRLGRAAVLVSVLLIGVSCKSPPAPPDGVESNVVPPERASDAPYVSPSIDSTPAPTTAPLDASADPIARIRDEGMNRSQVMQTLSYLTDVIGPRLTGSPNLKRANEWTREKLTSWGLVDAHLEPWGPFGRGWSLKRFSAQIVEPQAITLIAAPKAWSPGFDKAITADVIYLDAKAEADLDRYKGKLKGAIVLVGAPREVPARFEPPALRVTDADLLKMANSDGRNSTNVVGPARPPRASNNPEARELLQPDAASRPTTRGAATTTAATTQTTRPSPATAARFTRAQWALLASEGAALVVTPSNQGDGGTFFTGSAFIPSTQPIAQAATRPSGPSPWAADAPAILPQLTMAIEDYNRLVRMIKFGERPRMNVDLQVQYHTADPMQYNTIAEIPGTDLKDQIVMLGAHMDSWHHGTGATDNGAGVAATMEAVRILQALKLKPRRTIRIALWTGEEQGLYGSKAYVAKHFGDFEPAAPTTRPASRPTTRPTTRTGGRFAGSQPTTRKLLPGPEYDKLSAYFNLDNGTGKIRGVYLQGNEAARPLFRRWLAPFDDLGASTLTLNNTGGTDHLPFDSIGLPAFQFIQDPIEYWSRTHHSNEDVYDRIQADDMKQAATIIATFIYDAAMADDRVPRKAR